LSPIALIARSSRAVPRIWSIRPPAVER
jgi:hypothetical protein